MSRINNSRKRNRSKRNRSNRNGSKTRRNGTIRKKNINRRKRRTQKAGANIDVEELKRYVNPSRPEFYSECKFDNFLSNYSIDNVTPSLGTGNFGEVLTNL